MSKKKFDTPINNNAVRSKPIQSKQVTRKPILVDGLDVSKITGIEGANQSLVDFVDRISAANKAKSKSLNMTIGEANALMANLASIIAGK